MKKNLIFKYLLITFLITWISWVSLAILGDLGVMKYGQPTFMIIYILGGIGPLIAALISVKKSPEDFAVFKRELLKFRLNPLWYMGIILLPLVISGLGWLLNLLVTGKAALFFNQPLIMFLSLIPVMIVGGGLEEVGWRGILLPQLLKKTPPLQATLIVSVIWALWHLPLWFIRGTSQYGSSYLLFLLLVFSLSFILSTLYIKTRSILICILFHAFENAYMGIGLNLWAETFQAKLISSLIAVVVAMTIFWIFEKPLIPQRSLK